MTPESFVAQIQPLLPNLRSVVLYGSAVAGDFVPKVSKHDLLLVADLWSLAELQAIENSVGAWLRAGHPPPKCLTLDELLRAADVFPIEILDLQQSRRVLWGNDPIAKLQVDQEHLRLQLEHELRSKLLLLRQKLLAAGSDEKRLMSLLTASVTSFLVLFRAALRLYQSEVPLAKTEAAEALARHVPFSLKPLLNVLELKQSGAPPNNTVTNLARDYLEAIQTVVAAVDEHLQSHKREGQ